MTGLVRKATLLGVLGLLAAGSAFAFVPDPANSIVTVVKVVGYKSAPAVPDNDPIAQTTVTVKDAFGVAIANCQVRLDFSGCCDIVLCNDNGNPAQQQPMSCASRTVGPVLTDGSGIARFRVIGASRDPGTNPNPFPYLYGGGSAPFGCGLGGVKVIANSGTGDVDLLFAGPAVTYDLDGVLINGVTGVDVSKQINHFGQTAAGEQYLARGDQSCAFLAVPLCDAAITGVDVSAEIGTFGRLASTGGSAGCPGAAYCVTPQCGP